MPSKKTDLTNVEWQRLLHSVVVEIAALQQAGRSPMEVCNAHPQGSLIEHTTKAQLSQLNDGALQVRFASAQDQEAVLAGIESGNPLRIPETPKQKIDLEQARAKPEDLATEITQIRSSESDVDWVDISLQDVELKLAVRELLLSHRYHVHTDKLPDLQACNAIVWQAHSRYTIEQCQNPR